MLFEFEYSLSIASNLRSSPRHFFSRPTKSLASAFFEASANALCKIKIDGSKKKKVSGLVNNEIYNVTSKKIYYFDEVNSQICSSDLRGKTSKSIISISASKPKINIVKDFLYYLDDSKDDTQIYQMYRVKTDGSKTKTIDY